MHHFLWDDDIFLKVKMNTHKIDYYKEGKTTVINPGECGGWLTGKSTVAIFDLADLNVHMIELT